MAYGNVKIGFNAKDSQQYSPRAIIAIFPYVEKKLKLELHSFLVDNGDRVAKDSSLNLRSNQPIIITNDIITLSVESAKQGLQHSLSATFAPGTYNYLALCGPSDYMFAWIVNSSEAFDEVIEALSNGDAANWIDSGLKFFGQIQTIQESFRVAPNGSKTIRYNLSALGFQAYHSQVVYSPFLLGQDGQVVRNINFQRNFFNQGDVDIIAENLKSNWSVQEQLIAFHKVFLGAFENTKRKSNNEGPDIDYQRTVKNAFGIPAEVAATLGQKQKNDSKYTYADVIAFIIGVESFSRGDSGLLGPDSVILDENGKYGTYFTSADPARRLRGRRILNVSPSMNGTILSILQEHSNATINEIYATLRPRPNDDDSGIVPSFICRQIPFSKSEDQDFPTTNFFDLPRFEIDPSIIISYDLSKSDALRINTMLITLQPVTALGQNVRIQADNVFNGGWTYDSNDILRNGQRTYQSVVSDSPFVNRDEESGNNSGDKAGDPSVLKGYSKLVKDFLDNLHLKYSGTMVVAGIQEPICIGENIQFGEIVAHIEAISHHYQVNPGGMVDFNTNISFSHGMHLSAGSNELEMDGFRDDNDFNEIDGRSFNDIRGGQIKDFISTTQQGPLKLKDKK